MLFSAISGTIMRAVLTGLFIAAVWAAVLSPFSAQAQSQPLRSPFDVAAAREARGQPAGYFSCPSAPKAAKDLQFGGYYADRGAGSSVVDKQAEAAYREATRAINKFQADLTVMADRYVASKPADAKFAACALDWLADWAAAEAMLGRVSDQGGYVRKWGLAPISASYLKIRDESALDAAKKQAVEAWIKRYANTVYRDYDPEQKESRRNNHVYWAAWSVGLASVVLDDKKLFDWSMDKARLGLRQVTTEGILPLELARKSRAYHYHVFAAAPLVMVAELGLRNGVDLYQDRDGALKRLVGLVLANFDDDSFFAQKTGVKQDRSGSGKPSHFPWLEPYYAHTKDPAAAKLIAKLRPMRETRVGGDLTMYYGVDLR
jgi:poly(beta-D-mannuronate) lyase